VDKGLTAIVPDGATDPIWLIVALVAFETDQESVLLCPAVIVAGDAVKELMIGIGVLITVTVALAVLLPPPLEAVNV
jgi:hypothetical protein